MTTINEFRTSELLAEIDRREAAQRRELEPPAVWFYGVAAGRSSGHFLTSRHGRTDYPLMDRLMRAKPDGLYPCISSRREWDRAGGKATHPSWPGDKTEGQPEGILWHWRHNGQTWLMSFDRSADRRGNCVATWVVDRLLSPAEALRVAREAFPREFARIKAHLGREHTMGGPLFE